MSEKNIMETLYKTAFINEQNNGGCAQCTLSSINQHIAPISNDIFTAATALAGGGAASGNICGACSGGILAIGTFIGRNYEEFATTEGNDKKNRSTMISRKLLAKFEEEFGGFLCSEIQEKLYGKSYKMYIPEEKAEFLDNGGHGDKGCTMVCGKAAVWVYEILKEEGLIEG